MHGILRTEKLDLFAIVSIAVTACVLAAFVPADYCVGVWAAAAVITIIIMWAHFADPLGLVLAWLVTVACMSYFLWKHPVPLIGNVTVDRLFAVVLAAVALIGLIAGRLTWRPLPGAVKVALLMVAYFTLSLIQSGTRSIADVSPHFRLIGGYCIPLIVFVVAYLAVREDTQLRKIGWFFFAFGVYLTFTAWAEHLKLWSLVVPSYIADPDLGIHWGRSRGPFLVAVTLGSTLVFCFFSNLYLIRKTTGGTRLAIYAANVLMVPAIFFTQTRSVWLTMVVCTVIWVVWSRRIRSRIGVLGVLASAAVVVVAIFWTGITSRERIRGGVTDPYPIYARIGLAKISMNIFADHPVFGVGFGHFRDHASRLPADPASKYIRFGSRLMEHNNFLSILTETGAIGLALYVAVLWMLFKTSLRLYRRLSPTGSGWMTREFVIVYWILLANYVIDGMFRETSVDPFNNGSLFALSGVVLALDYLLASRAEPAVSAG